MPTLVVTYKDGTRSYPLREGVPVFIGRAKECDIHLPSPAVSRKHAVIIFKNGIFGIKDLGSFNGTTVNGRPVAGAQHLTDADVVQISSFLIRLEASEMNVDAQPRAPSRGTTVVIARDGGSPEETAAHDLPGDDDAQDKTRRQTRTYPNSHILLPRSMAPADGDVDKMLDGFREAGADEKLHAMRQGAETVIFSREGEDYFPGALGLGANPESTVEMFSPAEVARSLAREAKDDVEAIMPSGGKGGTSFRLRDSCEVFDTDYFRDEEQRGAAAPAADVPADSESSDAEKIIPMNEPDHAPRLTLEWDDDETNRALAALVADVSDDVSAARNRAVSERLSAITAQDADEAALSPEDTVDGSLDPAEAIRDADGDGDADGEPPVYDTLSVPPVAPVPDSLAEAITASHAAPGKSPPAFVSWPEEYAAAKTSVPGVDAVVIAPPLMAAISARLALYPLLLDLAEERKALRAANPELPAAVRTELDRQDAELDSLPTAEEADRMLSALAGRRRVATAEERENAALQRADEMAQAQWRLIRDSNRETLPAVYKEAYKLAADEPLARDFVAAKINHGRLFGGAVYLLALEALTATADEAGGDIGDQLRRLADKGLEKDKTGILGRLGRIGDTVNRVRNRTEIREKSQDLEERRLEHTALADRVRREFAFMEKVMNREFRQVFVKTAARFGGQDEMPEAVRAFLRYGVIGFKPWWMRAEIRDFIRNDCRDNIMGSIEATPGSTAVLYADECLTAVANMECSPFPDESLAGRDASSDEWRADRAYRRIVNANSYNILMDDMLSRLDGTLQEYDEKSADIARRITELKEWSVDDNANEFFSLETEQQVIAIRRENMQRHIARIEKEVVASILESVEDAEGRFRRGELRMPAPETLVAKEGESLAIMAKRIGGAEQGFMPLVVRGQRAAGALNRREAVAARLRKIEEYDPGVFASTIIPAKKKENRVELRLSPVVVIFPCSGTRGVFATPRDGMEGGHLVVPMCFSKKDIAEAVYAGLLADFRWETSRLLGGENVINSDTLAGAFMRFRQEWRHEPKPRREKGFIFNELTDKRNWRRVYAAYLADAFNSTRRLPARNPELYENVIAPYLL